MIAPVLLAALASAPAQASETAELADGAQLARDFQSASEHVLSGDLAGAITLYQHLEQRGVRHPDLYYDLGNAYARAGMLVDAVVSYERALRLDPSDDDARTNLGIVRSQLRPAARGHEPKEPSQLADLVEPIVGPLPQDSFAIALAISEALFFGALVLLRFGRRRFSVTFVALASFAAMVLTGAVVTAHEIVHRDPRAVVTHARELKQGPHNRFGKSGDVFAGERVRIRKEEQGWLEVENEVGHRGWIAETDLVPF
jgi:tetratricopeptide (TPR) repeat protein